MSIRVESNGSADLYRGTFQMEDVTVYATTRAEALSLDRSRYMIGSVLYVVSEGTVYMLDADGNEGVWRSMKDGSVLGDGGDGA